MPAIRVLAIEVARPSKNISSLADILLDISSIADILLPVDTGNDPLNQANTAKEAAM